MLLAYLHIGHRCQIDTLPNTPLGALVQNIRGRGVIQPIACVEMMLCDAFYVLCEAVAMFCDAVPVLCDAVGGTDQEPKHRKTMAVGWRSLPIWVIESMLTA
jgi:hypothetical protein